MRHGTHGSQRIAQGCALTLAPMLVLTACGDSSHPLAATPYDAADKVSVNADGKTVDPEKPLELKADGDQITDVTAVDAAGRYLRGELSADGSRWRSTGPLVAGTAYTVRFSTENDSGRPGRGTVRFDTREPEAKKLLKVKLGPDSGTYGVGQPVTAELSRKVKSREQRQIIERALKVRSTPKVRGSWHWVDGKKLHYRPKEYWPTHASITVESQLAGVKVRDGLYGGKSKRLRLKTGDRIEATVDSASLQMTVKKNGEVINTIPVTTGRAGYSTRNGTKVILEKQQAVRMTSASIGASDFYDKMVYWNTRLTWSGEYAHGAPWSVGSQGYANVSHGCVGMSSGNAQWFYNLVRPGDVVTNVNSAGADMSPFGNGFGDWNMSWDDWRKGSALVNDTPETTSARLRPEI